MTTYSQCMVSPSALSGVLYVAAAGGVVAGGAIVKYALATYDHRGNQHLFLFRPQRRPVSDRAMAVARSHLCLTSFAASVWAKFQCSKPMGAVHSLFHGTIDASIYCTNTSLSVLAVCHRNSLRILMFHRAPHCRHLGCHAGGGYRNGAFT